MCASAYISPDHSMEQFSHDLTAALEETSKSDGVRTAGWVVRRRTRSTGNLPCAPQPTEDSSSSPADCDGTTGGGPPGANGAGGPDAMLSDSDGDRPAHEAKLHVSRQSCMFGNFESDSLNETVSFSPARPNTRRKRKLKRNAVEYETTPSTPGAVPPLPLDAPDAMDATVLAFGRASVSEPPQNAPGSPLADDQPTTAGPLATAAGALGKKPRSLFAAKPDAPLAVRSNVLFFGKRKRSHRDRYYEQHSSSVPRHHQRDHHHHHHGHHHHYGHHAKHSYSEYRSRNRSFSSAFGAKMCLAGERIAPLNNSIVSKIERIAQLGNADAGFRFVPGMPASLAGAVASVGAPSAAHAIPIAATSAANRFACSTLFGSRIGFGGPIAASASPATANAALGKPSPMAANHIGLPVQTVSDRRFGLGEPDPAKAQRHKDGSHHMRKMQRRSKRQQLKLRLQFDDDTDAMDAAMHSMDAVSSSSMSSSSDSEAAQRNDTDREGDDELTDWPGNEAMVNFASKNDFKRAKPRQLAAGKLPALPFIRSDVDDETLMSADETPANGMTAAGPPTTLPLHTKCAPQSVPIAIVAAVQPSLVESELSGETSNNFLSSPGGIGAPIGSAIVGNGPLAGGFAAGSFPEVREIRAGCRRVRNERPGFTILTSVNEDLSRFLQDARKESLRLPDTDANEHEKLTHLANLYSLSMHGENGYMILTKTKKTMQSVKIERSSNNSGMPKRFLGDHKRRCYGETADDDEDIGDETREPDDGIAMAI